MNHSSLFSKIYSVLLLPVILISVGGFLLSHLVAIESWLEKFMSGWSASFLSVMIFLLLILIVCDLLTKVGHFINKNHKKEVHYGK